MPELVWKKLGAQPPFHKLSDALAPVHLGHASRARDHPAIANARRRSFERS